MAKAPFVEDQRLKHLLNVPGVSGEFPVRNGVLLMCVHGFLKFASPEVRDYPFG